MKKSSRYFEHVYRHQRLVQQGKKLGLTGKEIAFLLDLMGRADADFKCFPGISDIGNGCIGACSISKVRQSLIDKGWIKSYHETLPNGKRRLNYTYWYGPKLLALKPSPQRDNVTPFPSHRYPETQSIQERIELGLMKDSAQ